MGPRYQQTDCEISLQASPSSDSPLDPGVRCDGQGREHQTELLGTKTQITDQITLNTTAGGTFWRLD